MALSEEAGRVAPPVSGGCKSPRTAVRLSSSPQPWPISEHTCCPPWAGSGAEGWEALGNAESTRYGGGADEHQGQCLGAAARRGGWLLLLNHLYTRLHCCSPPRSTTAFLWHLGWIAPRNIFKANKAAAELLRLGEKGKSSLLAPGVPPLLPARSVRRGKGLGDAQSEFLCSWFIFIFLETFCLPLPGQGI